MNAMEWNAWIDGWRAWPPDDLSGYRSEVEVQAVSALDALLAAVEEHFMRLAHNGEPAIRHAFEVALEGLRDLRRHHPRRFASHAANILGLAMPPRFDHRAYAAWCARQEVGS